MKTINKRPSKKLVLLIIVLIAGATYYLVDVYKPSTPEFMELKRQERLLELQPHAWRYETIDRGHWMSSGGSGEPANIHSYSRSIRISYKSKNTEAISKQIVNRLHANGWRAADDKDLYPLDKSGQYDQTGRLRDKKIYTASREFFTKNGREGIICASVASEYNWNYQQDSPWLVGISLMGKTDSGCRHLN